MSNKRRLGALAAAAAMVAGLAVHLQPAAAATTVFTGTGAGVPGAITAFQTALGGNPMGNGNTPPPQTTGFRRINWDGVPVTGANAIVEGAVGDVAQDLFQPRGVILSDDNAVAVDGFNSVNPAANTGHFPAFTPTRIFAPYNDNQVEVNFVFASARGATPIPAASKGFGVVFEDVTRPGATTIELFKGATSLGVFPVPVGGHGVQSFLGVVFDTPRITRAVITLGDSTIFFRFGDTTDPGGTDFDSAEEGDELVTADDFIYGEPMCTRTLGAVSSPTIVAANSDIVCLNGTTVNGSISLGTGAVLVMNNGFVAGNISSNGGGGLMLCGTTVRGAVAVQNSTGFVRIGDAQNDDGLGCAPNNIRNSVSVLAGHGGFEVGGNQVGGNVTLNDNELGVSRLETPPAIPPTGDDGHEVEGNVIGGQLTCLRNSPAVTDDEKPNVVTGTVNCQFFVID